MAAVVKRPGGHKWISFWGPDGRRYTLRLGKCSLATANTVRVHVEHLQAAKMASTAAPLETQQWLTAIDDKLHDRIVRVHLTTPRRAAAGKLITVHQLADQYLASRRADKVAENTLQEMNSFGLNLKEYFPASKQVATVTAHDAAEFVRWMRGTKSYAQATWAKRVKLAKQFFKSAIRRGVITANPFEDQKAPAQVNRERIHFVPREDVQRLIDAAPDDQWRAVIALARYGGLRCPSEVIDLKWEAINWVAGRFTVAAHKSDQRIVPLFPELRPYLEESFELAPEGARFVIHRRRGENTNFRAGLLKIAERAGVVMWVKPFQNMRASRETELLRSHPIHVAASWIGNSPQVALQHYLMVTEDDMRAAALDAAGRPGGPADESKGESTALT